MALFTVRTFSFSTVFHPLHLITVMCNEFIKAIFLHLTRPSGIMFIEKHMTGTHHHHSSMDYCHVLVLQYNYHIWIMFCNVLKPQIGPWRKPKLRKYLMKWCWLYNVLTFKFHFSLLLVMNDVILYGQLNVKIVNLKEIWLKGINITMSNILIFRFMVYKFLIWTFI